VVGVVKDALDGGKLISLELLRGRPPLPRRPGVEDGVDQQDVYILRQVAE